MPKSLAWHIELFMKGETCVFLRVSEVLQGCIRLELNNLFNMSVTVLKSFLFLRGESQITGGYFFILGEALLSLLEVSCAY